MKYVDLFKSKKNEKIYENVVKIIVKVNEK